ncbi:MAG: hypothetical protein IJK89_01235 [Clostridia bacterium]|nr:hypothetical protein [Clostridia bacterium]
MKKAGGILVTKDNNYNYIDTFINFLWRIVKIIIVLFDKIKGNATPTDAEELGALDDVIIKN